MQCLTFVVFFLLGYDLSLAGASTQGYTRGKFFVRPSVMLEFDTESPGKGITIRFGSAAHSHHSVGYCSWQCQMPLSEMRANSPILDRVYVDPRCLNEGHWQLEFKPCVVEFLSMVSVSLSGRD